MVKNLLIYSVLFFLSFNLFSQSVDVCGFSYKKVITIDGSKVIGSHTNFPILIDHTDGVNLVPTSMGVNGKLTSANGYDIAFASDGAELLEFQLESYDATTGHIVAWVKVPLLQIGTDVVIHMLYGKSAITTDQSTTGVWDDNYVGVYHMNDFSDQSANTNDASNFGAVGNPSSKIGAGKGFDAGQLDYVEVPTVDWNVGSGTVSFWGNQSSFSANEQYFFGHTLLPAFSSRIQLYVDDVNGELDLGLGDSHTRRTNIQNLTANTWYHISLTWNGSDYVVYVDGVNKASGTFTGLSSLYTIAEIGNNGNAASRNESIIGGMDEVRISDLNRSGDWIATSHVAQDSPEGDFYEISPEVNNVYTSKSNLTNADWDRSATWTGDPSNVPHVGADITIRNQVDLNAGSSDYIICSCTLSTDIVDKIPNIDMDDARELIIIQDLILNANADERIIVTLNDDGTELNVLGDLYVDNSSVGNQTITINVSDDVAFNVSGNAEFKLVSGDNINMILNSDAKFNIDKDLFLDQDGGDDILFRMNNTLAGAGEFKVKGNMTIDHDGGDDFTIRTVDASSLFKVDGDLTIDWNDNNAGNNDDLTLDLDDGNFVVAGNTAIARRNDARQVLFDLDGGDFITDGLSFNNSGTNSGNNNFFVAIDESSLFTVNGIFDVEQSGGGDVRMFVNSAAGTDAKLIVAQDLKFNRTGGNNIEFVVDQNDSEINIGRDFIMTSSGGGEVNFDLNKEGLFTVERNVDITYLGGDDCELDLEYVTNGSGASFNVDGDFYLANSAGNAEWLFDLNGGSFTVDNDMTLVNDGAGGAEDIEFELDDDALFTVGNDLNLQHEGGDNFQFEIGDNSSSSVNFNIGRDLNMAHDGGDDFYINFRDATTGTIGRDLNMTSKKGTGTGNVFYYRLNTSSELNVLGDISFNGIDDGTLELDLKGNSILRIGGDFVRLASPLNYGALKTEVNATVEYNGSTSQFFAEDAGGGVDFFNYQNVIINNNAGLVMEGLATVHGNLTFTDGVVQSTATNLLVIDDGGAALSASDASFVDGPVKKIGNTSFVFPVGDDAQIQPIEMEAPAVGTDEFTAQFFGVDPHPTYDNTKLQAEVESISDCEYWILDRVNGSSNVKVTLHYDANSCGITDLSTLHVAHWTGVQWESLYGDVIGDLTSGTVQTPIAVEDFSPFTTSNFSGVLPIELISFNAKRNQAQVDLSWVTASEINNDFFTVERSDDSENWYDVLVQSSVGNSSEVSNYAGVDLQPLSGVSYYRLKQTDLDGAFTYSQIVSVNWDEEESFSFSVFPNPVNGLGFVNLVLGELSGQNLEIGLSDVTGKVYSSENYNAQENESLKVKLVNEMPSGVYFISIVTEGGETYYEKLMVD